MILELLLQYFLFPQVSAFEYVASGFDTAIIQEVSTDDQATLPSRNYGDIFSVDISAKSAIAVDAITGSILYEYNSEDKRSIASITKLMTAMVFLDQGIDPTKMVTLREEDRQEGGMIHINIGEKIAVKDLLYSALVGSDNDSAYALARIGANSVDEFVKEMNKKAKELGMNNTTFEDPTGLYDSNRSTARDIVIMLNAANKYPEIRKATTLPSYEFSVEGLYDKKRHVKVYNTDKLADSNYLELIIGKTGYLESAGYCLASKIKGQSNREIYIVVLGSDTIQKRFQDTKAIEYFVFNEYTFN